MTAKNQKRTSPRVRRDRYGRPELVMGDHVLGAGARPRPADQPSAGDRKPQ